MDRILTSITNQGQSDSGCKSNGGVLETLQLPRTGDSSSDLIECHTKDITSAEDTVSLF